MASGDQDSGRLTAGTPALFAPGSGHQALAEVFTVPDLEKRMELLVPWGLDLLVHQAYI